MRKAFSPEVLVLVLLVGLHLVVFQMGVGGPDGWSYFITTASLVEDGDLDLVNNIPHGISTSIREDGRVTAVILPSGEHVDWTARQPHVVAVERIEETGRVVSHEALGTSLLHAPFYWIADRASRSARVAALFTDVSLGREVYDTLGPRDFVKLVGVLAANNFYTLAALVLVFVMLRELGHGPKTSLAITLMLFAASPIHWYGANGQSHAPDTFVMALVFYWLLRMTVKEEELADADARAIASAPSARDVTLRPTVPQGLARPREPEEHDDDAPLLFLPPGGGDGEEEAAEVEEIAPPPPPAVAPARAPKTPAAKSRWGRLPVRTVILGMLVGAASVVRYANVVFIPAGLVYLAVFRRDRRDFLTRAGLFLAGVLSVAWITPAYWRIQYGSWLSPIAREGRFGFDSLWSLLRPLFSSTHGFLAFSPLFALGLLATIEIVYNRDALRSAWRLTVFGLTGFAFISLLYASYNEWEGGGYGARFFTAMMVPLAVGVAQFAGERHQRVARFAFAGLAAAYSYVIFLMSRTRLVGNFPSSVGDDIGEYWGALRLHGPGRILAEIGPTSYTLKFLAGHPGLLAAGLSAFWVLMFLALMLMQRRRHNRRLTAARARGERMRMGITLPQERLM